MSAITATPSESVANNRLLGSALIAAALAAAINLALFFILPALLNTPLRVRTPQAADLEPLSFIAVIFASVIPSLIGAGVLYVLGRFTTRPITIFRVLAVVITILSFGGPLQLGISTAEVIVLELMHLVAAVVITYLLTTRARAS
jgi:hypothetical protein